MKRLTFELQFITPAFIGGANPREAELRPASFIGLLRWWWRALKGLDDTEKLYREEVEIFGGQLEKSYVASRVFLRLEVNGEGYIEDGINFVKSLEVRSRRENNKDAGLFYLLYAPLLPKRERKFIKPGTTFKLILTGEEEILKHWVASLWALVFLGGVGLRARRGGGNLRCISVESSIDYLSFYPDEKDLYGWYVENFKKAIQLVGGGKDFCSEYSNLSLSRLMISSSTFRDWKEALNEIGERFMSFRREHKTDLLGLSAFGLPIRHSDGSMQQSKKRKRRASPLIIKVLKLNEGYRWALVRLNGAFLEEGDSIVVGNKELKGRVLYTLIDEFYRRLRKEKLGVGLLLHKPESLERLVERIKKEFVPKKIVIFGSRARGDARRDSDIDIAIYTDRPVDTGSFVANADIVIYDRADERLKEFIQKEGVVLYEKREG